MIRSKRLLLYEQRESPQVRYGQWVTCLLAPVLYDSFAFNHCSSGTILYRPLPITQLPLMKSSHTTPFPLKPRAGVGETHDYERSTMKKPDTWHAKPLSQNRIPPPQYQDKKKSGHFFCSVLRSTATEQYFLGVRNSFLGRKYAFSYSAQQPKTPADSTGLRMSPGAFRELAGSSFRFLQSRSFTVCPCFCQFSRRHS